MQKDASLAADAGRNEPDEGTGGWDAIRAALAGLYPGQTPRHHGSALPWTLGGDDPLDGISVYWAAVPRPHWHYVTFGFSELFAKQSQDPAVSGFGFELTLRLTAPPDARSADTPPTWPMNLLQNLARYVFETGNVLEQGHHLDANGPIALEHRTLLRHLAFMQDPQLPPIDTVNGRLQFLQVIGLADGEKAAIIRWSADQVLHMLAPAMPLWITDLERADLLDDPALVAQVDAGSRLHGSSTVALFVQVLEWTPADAGDGSVVLVLGAAQVPSLLQLLPARMPFGRNLELTSGERSWLFAPGDVDEVRLDGDTAQCTLTPATLQSLLSTLRPQRGRYRFGDGQPMQVDVRPTEMRDGEGNYLRTIG